ncbi:MAG: hypothetical protein LUF32_06255 [Clostridiales bacterium]|nr:hypothetical protein [Clostridiales bacterium]
MQEPAIVLGGFEPVYMQKLAICLGSRLNGEIQVGITEDPKDELLEDRSTIWVGSEQFIESVRGERAAPSCIVLTEEEDSIGICRYQSCEKLYQKIMFRYREMHGAEVHPITAGRQEWIVMTTDDSSSDLLAFSMTCAQILGDRKGVLYLNLSECSGMEELFLLEQGTDLTDLTVALRRKEDVCLEAYARQLEQVDYIMPPANPMILHELREPEIRRLIQTVRNHREYDCVVTALGTGCCGCELFFQAAARIFHLNGGGGLSEYSGREWLRFIRLCLGSKETPIEQIQVPRILTDQGGIHLIHEWKEGSPGRLARNYLEGKKT